MASRCLLFAVLFLLAIAVSSNSEGDALGALKARLSDPENALKSWDTTLDNPCTWFHVNCDSNNNVIRLDLGNNKHSGTLAPELGDLQHLQYLELFSNNIGGKLPAELGNLKNLISMDLYHNNLEGEIPKSCSNLKSLRYLRLNDNKLTGTVPRAVIHLPNLKVLDVSNKNVIIPPFGSFSIESFANNKKLIRP